MRRLADGDCGTPLHTGIDVKADSSCSSKGVDAECSRKISVAKLQQRIRSHTPLYRRDEYVDKVKRALTPLEVSHGALFESVVIHGSEGAGKRTIAIQAANEICAQDGRTLLIINGKNFETFIPSYLETFQTLTGSYLPAAEHWFYSLYNLKHYLDRHRTEWLMVITDVGMYLDNELDGPGRPLAWFLPTRGQIIMTSSSLIEDCLRAAANATSIRLRWLGDADMQRFARYLWPGFDDTSVYERLMGLSGNMPLSFAIIAANLKLLDVNLQTYVRIFETRLADRKAASRKADFCQFDLEDNVHREILWDALGDRDRWSLRLIAAMSFLDPWSIPIDIIENMSVFRNTISDRVAPSLSLLESLGIANVVENHVWIHPTLHAWFRSHVWLRYSWHEWLVLRSAMAESILQRLKTRSTDGFYSCWSLGPHIYEFSDMVRKHPGNADVKLLNFMSFVADVAVFRAQILKHGQTCIYHAQDMASHPGSRPVLERTALNEYNYAHARFRLAHTMVHADGPADYSRAAVELRGAKHYVQLLKNDTRYHKLLEHSWLIETQVMFGQGLYHALEDFILGILCGTSPISERTRTRLYHMMARTMEEQGQPSPALQYSHEAMSYWYHYRHDEKSPTKRRRAALIIDTHIDLLIKRKKYRGALLFILPLLESKLNHSPQHPCSVWKLARQGVLCYGMLLNVVEAEQLIYRLLDSHRDGGLKEGVHEEIAYDIEDESVFYYFDMLVRLAGLYIKHGRIIEADGLLRYSIGVGLPRMATLGHVLNTWWQDLMICLWLRNDQNSLEKLAVEYRDAYDWNFSIRDIEGYMLGVEDASRVYQQAMWAAEDGWLDEWNSSYLDMNGRKFQYASALRLFGDPADRLAQGRDACWIDLDFGAAQAKRNKLLHLIGFDVVDLTFVSKLASLPPGEYRDTALDVERGAVFPNPGRIPRLSPPYEARTGCDPELEPKAEVFDFDAFLKDPARVPDVVDDADHQSDTDPVHGEPAQGHSGAAENPDAHTTNSVDNATSTTDTAHEEDEKASASKSPPSLNKTEPVPLSSKEKKKNKSKYSAHVKGKTPPWLDDLSTPNSTESPQRWKHKDPRSENDAHTFKLHILEMWVTTHHQYTLPEYWKWCYCRRHRSRSGSINPVDIIDKRFLRQMAERDERETQSRLVQKKITDCFLILPPEPKPLPEGCHKDCPCHEANRAGLEEWETQQKWLVTWPEDDPVPDQVPYWPSEIYTGPDKRSKHRFVKPHRPPPTLLPNEVFILEWRPRQTDTIILTPPPSSPEPASVDLEESRSTKSSQESASQRLRRLRRMRSRSDSPPMISSAKNFHNLASLEHPNANLRRPRISRFRYPRPPPRCPVPGGTWTWKQSELYEGDQAGQNYLLKVPLSGPITISITLAEDQWALPGTKAAKQWYWKDVGKHWYWKDVELQEVRLVPEELQNSTPDEALDMKVLTKRKEFIYEYFPREHRFCGKVLIDQEWQLEWVHPKSCEAIEEIVTEDNPSWLDDILAMGVGSRRPMDWWHVPSSRMASVQIGEKFERVRVDMRLSANEIVVHDLPGQEVMIEEAVVPKVDAEDNDRRQKGRSQEMIWWRKNIRPRQQTKVSPVATKVRSNSKQEPADDALWMPTKVDKGKGRATGW
ncbi:uncharacterized protein AB675_11600 [Cyphellophora attinorum]|uniref:Uncharacterized protein n=1 Tax=Cyphellophora attinorum TaxID=1664694 RepID=A0A0N1H434_9EURO|nr:uncharacterized protein AB675_11600 [Phialophora attinorum]KPI39977.1 hypothetical protein AB675_11600 [Phialophora attinorum]